MKARKDHPSRRQFLRLTAGSTLALLAGSRLRALGAGQPTGQVARVHLHRFDPAATEATDAVRAAMLAATDLSWLHAGDSVLIKVASNSKFAPPAVTSPAVLSGVIQVLREAGAGDIAVGDMSGAFYVRHLADQTIGSTRDNMRENGLLAAAEAAGVRAVGFEETPFDQAYISGIPPGSHHWSDDLQVAAVLDQVDHVVNLPRLGKHLVAGASLGLKNAIGWISDHSRMVLHRDAATFHEKVAEVNAIPQLVDKMRLTLTLVDHVLTTEGPDSGYILPLEEPLIIASEDVVSHDQIALLTLLWARQLTPRSALDADRYLSQGDELNWWFVRVTWGAEAAAAYQSLPVFADLASAEAATHINLAYDILHGGRPDRIEVSPGGLALPDALTAVLTRNPDLRIVLSS